MSEYKTLFGKAVKALASDPTDAGAEGQIWYNTTTGSFRTVLQSFAFSSGGSMPVARDLGTGGGATQNSAWVAAGENGATVLNSTAEYNGASWTTTGNIGTGRIRLAYGNNGPETAGLATGGFIPPGSTQSIVEEYNGSTWAAGTGLPTSIQFAGGTGPQTANIILGGVAPLTRSLEYDGSTWTTGGSSSENMSNYGLAGIQTAALAFYGSQNSGGGPPHRTTGEEYNGASWSTVAPSLINQRGSGAATGTTSAAIFLGNSTTVTSWDGTSLTNEPAMSQSRGNGFSGGLATSGVVSGGSAPGSTANVEEFDRTIYSPIAATWASGGNLNTPVNLGTTFGTQTATVQAGGGPPFTGATEEYDGSSWTTSPGSLNTSRGQVLASSGVLTAGLAFGGGTPSDSNATEEYDGSTWTTTGNMNLGRRYISGFGIQTATIAAGGFTSPPAANRNNSEEYNGSTWTTGPTISNARNGLSGTGTTSAGLIFAGSPQTLNGGFTEEWNGTAWSEQNDMNVKRSQVGRAGTQTDALVAGGNQNPPYSAATEGYDGTSWSTRPSMSTARATSGDGTATAAIVAGGSTPAATNATEEYTGETFVLDYKTITTS